MSHIRLFRLSPAIQVNQLLTLILLLSQYSELCLYFTTLVLHCQRHPVPFTLNLRGVIHTALAIYIVSGLDWLRDRPHFLCAPRILIALKTKAFSPTLDNS